MNANLIKRNIATHKQDRRKNVTAGDIYSVLRYSFNSRLLFRMADNCMTGP